jgi:hypothetical protein
MGGVAYAPSVVHKAARPLVRQRPLLSLPLSLSSAVSRAAIAARLPPPPCAPACWRRWLVPRRAAA